MLVEAAFSASKAPGPLRTFYQRVRARRGIQVAIVATARKLTVLSWHLMVKHEDYAFALPSLVAHKQRKLELRAGLSSTRGRKGIAAAYSLEEVRAAERGLTTQTELAYRTMVANWRPQPPTPKPTPKPAATSTKDGRGRQHRDTTLKPTG
jgi:ATP/maltotriose-dependent transcriptional regulator MalT